MYYHLLKNQFLITRKEMNLAWNWKLNELGNWLLYSHESLPVIRIISSDKQPIGWIIGFAIDLETGIVRNERILNINSTKINEKKSAEIEKEIYSLGGRYIFIIISREFSRVYLDSAGSLSVIYHKDSGYVASTCSVIPLDNLSDEWDTELMKYFPTHYLPFGFTPHRSFSRLLPNHYLDLGSFKAIRHYPLINSFISPYNIDQLEEIAGTMKRMIDILATEGSYMTLTGGIDNRIMLACSRDIKEKLIFFTNSASSKTDMYLSRKISNQLGLNHVFVDNRAATPMERDLMNILSGYCMENHLARLVPLHREKLTMRKFQITGTGGETGRCFFWKKNDHHDTVLDARSLLLRMNKPLYPPIAKAAKIWLNELTGFSAFYILDLLFLEQDTGCRASPNMYVYDSLTFTPIHAFSHRKIIENLVLLPAGYKRRNDLYRDMCMKYWPELLQYPVNSYGGIRGGVYDLKQRIKKNMKPLVAGFGSSILEIKKSK